MGFKTTTIIAALVMFATAYAAPEGRSGTDAGKPNIIFVLTDDLPFRGSRGEGKQVLEECPQFAVVRAARQSGQELFYQHFSGLRNSQSYFSASFATSTSRT